MLDNKPDWQTSSCLLLDHLTRASCSCYGDGVRMARPLPTDGNQFFDAYRNCLFANKEKEKTTYKVSSVVIYNLTNYKNV